MLARPKSTNPSRSPDRLRRCTYPLACLIFLTALSSAQQVPVSTTDGKQLLFLTDLRLRGSDEVTTPKVFRWNGESFELVAQESDFPPYLIGALDIIGDGTVVSYTD